MVQTGREPSRLPTYDELPVTPGNPPLCAWGLWGERDELGMLNLLTPERVARAARLARSGRRFGLSWSMELPEPPLFFRQRSEHAVLNKRPFVNDDFYTALNPQSSSHWDGFTHYGNAEHQCFFMGVQPAEITGHPGTRNSIHVWAERGIAGRGVLIDYRRWAEANGITYSPGEHEAITVAGLLAAAGDQGVQFETGDILLVRTGFTAWYESLTAEARAALAKGPHTFAGVAQGHETLRFLWDNHFAAVGGDAPSFEAWPPTPGMQALHPTLLPLWGMPIGEMFNLEALAADCARDGVYEFLLTSEPLNKLGGVATPANALAIK